MNLGNDTSINLGVVMEKNLDCSQGKR
jgi:hypothetical protein